MANYRFLLAVLVLSLAWATLVPAKTVEEAITDYRFKNETADYATVTFNDSSYYFIRFNGNLSVILDSSLEPVTALDDLTAILKKFYESTGKIGFSETTAANINASFSTAYAAFKQCNMTYYDMAEMNYFVYGYRCADPSTGVACDLGANYRKNVSDSFLSIAPKIADVTTNWESMEPAKLMEELAAIRDLADIIKTDMEKWNTYYKFFRGDFHADDARCGYDNSQMSRVSGYAKDAVSKGVVDVRGDAQKLLQEYENRKSVTEVRAIIANGRKLVEEGQEIASSFEQDYEISAFSNSYKELLAAYETLKLADSLEEANAKYTETNAKLDALKAQQVSLQPVLQPFKEASAALFNASGSISKAKAKYGGEDVRIAQIEKEYTGLRQRLENTKTEIDVGHYDNATRELNEIKTKGIELDRRAATLPSAESELDPLMIATIVVLVLAVVGLVYYFKVRKPPKEVDIRNLQDQKEEQHRDAVFPRA
ncbi:MAG: hypothetical protein V1787_06330 [Candidatus Micrarchaeota archaeon]